MLSPHEKHNFSLGVTCTDVFLYSIKINIHYWNDMCNVYTLRNRKIYISNMKLILIHILLFLAKKTLNMQNNLRLIGLTGLMGSLDYAGCVAQLTSSLLRTSRQTCAPTDSVSLVPELNERRQELRRQPAEG